MSSIDPHRLATFACYVPLTSMKHATFSSPASSAFTVLAMAFFGASSAAAMPNIQFALFEPPDTTPTMNIGSAISRNGDHVVGIRGRRASWTSRRSNFVASQWTPGVGVEQLGDFPNTSQRSEAAAVSDDGSIVVGTGSFGPNEIRVATMWRNGEVINLDPEPPRDVGSSSFPFEFASAAFDVSGDGTVVVGQRTTASGRTSSQAFRWENGQFQTLNESETFGRANAVSADGSVVVGVSGTQPFRWEAGSFTGLPTTSQSCCELSRGEAIGVSDDGGVIVGQVLGSSGPEAARWVDGQLSSLGDLPGGDVQSIANAVSRNGDIVVGTGRIEDGDRAFYWDAVGGMRSLDDFLEQELQINTDWILVQANGMTADGTRITGWATRPDSGTEIAFLLTIPEPSTTLLIALGLIPLAWRRGRGNTVDENR